MTEMYLPNPNNAVVHALRKTRMRVRHSRPLFIEGECIASTYITRRQKNGLNTTMSTTANATTATVLGSLGPAGASTTVQKWLTVTDNGGVVRYIPCF